MKVSGRDKRWTAGNAGWCRGRALRGKRRQRDLLISLNFVITSSFLMLFGSFLVIRIQSSPYTMKASDS